MEISRLDHFVLTTARLEECLRFYTDILGMELRRENGRYALFFGAAKINIHTRPAEFLPAAKDPRPGALDLCFVVRSPIEAVMRELQARGISPRNRHCPPPRRGRRHAEYLPARPGRQSRRALQLCRRRSTAARKNLNGQKRRKYVKLGRKAGE